MSQTTQIAKAEVHCYIKDGVLYVTPKAILVRYREDGAKPTIVGKLLNGKIIK